jgi:DNA-binding protein YbaB
MNDLNNVFKQMAMEAMFEDSVRMSKRLLDRAEKNDTLSALTLNAFKTAFGHISMPSDDPVDCLMIAMVAELIVGAFMDATGKLYLNDPESRAKVTQQMAKSIDETIAASKKRFEAKVVDIRTGKGVKP